MAAILGSACLLMSCSQRDDQSNPSFSEGETESGIFEDFKYPEKYARIVAKAEGGDRSSVMRLAEYYGNFPTTDLRNLEYWSEKASHFDGPIAYTNLVVALAAHDQCDRAWSVLETNYAKLSDFPFYASDGATEMIDGRCERGV